MISHAYEALLKASLQSYDEAMAWIATHLYQGESV